MTTGPPEDGRAGLDAVARARLAALADLMIPAADGMPSASEVGVADAGVDYLLGVRPDLAAPLTAALEAAALDAVPAVDRPEDGPGVLAALRQEHPDLVAAVGEIVAGAYYLNPDVADRVGYHGRVAIPVESDPADADPDDPAAVALRRPVVDRGPCYRADPRSECLDPG